MKNRGFTLIEIVVVIAMVGVLAIAMAGGFVPSEQRKHEVYQLITKTERLLSVGTEYYRSACHAPDFQLTLNNLKQKQLIDNDFSYPIHHLEITAAQTVAAFLHLRITLNNDLAATFVAEYPKAQLIDANTVSISVPVSTQLMPQRQQLLSMKALWGEAMC